MSKIISEVFISLQGEGLRTGIRSVFIRTLGCNLRCKWCDTPYTSWNLEKGIDEEYALEYIRQSDNTRDIVITGGEPCLHTKFLYNLMKLCRERNKFVTLETNGTIDEIHFNRNIVEAVDLVSISPKLKDSAPNYDEKWFKLHNRERINLPVIRAWIDNAKDYQLKFVVNHDSEIEEINNLLREIEDLYEDHISLDLNKIWLMPEGRTEEELKAKREWLAKKCIETGFRYCERQHIIIWGSKRGV